jgi:DNA-binding NarL/FixJ family response regulator
MPGHACHTKFNDKNRGVQTMTNLRTGNEPQSGRLAGLANLTPRELEVLQLVLAGKTNKAIAREISISSKTVEFHLENIYTKIGARTRLLAGLWAIQQGIAAQTREIPS